MRQQKERFTEIELRQKWSLNESQLKVRELEHQIVELKSKWQDRHLKGTKESAAEIQKLALQLKQLQQKHDELWQMKTETQESHRQELVAKDQAHQKMAEQI